MSDILNDDHYLTSFDEEVKIEPTPEPESKKKKKKTYKSNLDSTDVKPKKKKEVYMTWGKYKSKLVKDIIYFDEKYAQWLYKQDFVKKFEDIYKVLDDHFSNN